MSPCHGEDRQFKSDRGRHILFFTILYAVVAEWQTRYFEGVVIFRSCEFKSHQPHHSFFLLDSLNSILYAVVAELADALSSGGSGVIRESSNLSDRTTKMRKSSSIGWAFLLRLPEWSVRLFSLAACLALPCGRYFCIGILRKRRSFSFAARRRMCTRSPWEASLPGAIMI